MFFLSISRVVVNQFYEAEIMTEYVIRGNAGLLKCSIPSFVADFVRMESWIDEVGTELRMDENYGVNCATLFLLDQTYIPVPNYNIPKYQ